MFQLIRLSLWGTGISSPNQSTFEEMQKHAIASLPAGILSSLNLPPDLLLNWKTFIYQQVMHNVNCLNVQKNLPITVPFVILKGTSAAQYYPHPQFRAMGDIDIMTRREDLEAACSMLLENGYRELRGDDQWAEGRHRQFEKDGILIEVHMQFSYQNDVTRARLIDELIIDHIDSTHILPDPINGIILLEHINHHIENGIGLRHIIDWMMFVDKCLPDEKWQMFREIAECTGHVELAKITTRMCEIYLGLSEHKWCDDVDPAICDEFMQYVLINGNFGRKKDRQSRVGARFFSSTRTINGAFRFLQGRGLLNWKAAREHSWLKPFAWMYQTGRYLKKGLTRKDNIEKVKREYRDGIKRNKLLDALGVSREDQGIVRYRNGLYVKE